MKFTIPIQQYKNQMSIGKRVALKRAISILTAVTTILSLSGIAMIAPASAATPADYGLREGDVISAAGSSDPDVYIVNEHGYKRLFLNPAIFNFYGHLGGFAAVKNVTPTARDAFPTSGLFRVTGTEKVYGVEVTGEDVAVLHWVNTSGAQAVADDANFFKKVFVINQTEFNWYAQGTAYTSVNQVPNYSRTTPTPTPSTGISVSLASDNPAAGTLVKNQAIADLAHFQFSGSGSVTSLKLKRLGVSADTDLTNVYLYDGVKRLTDAASVANGEISFNDTAGLFTVSGSRTISVRADLHATNTGQTLGVQLISVNGNAVSVSGNLFTVANATLATVTLSDNTDPAANTSLDPADDVVAWRQTITASERYVWLRSIQIRVIGSVLPGDLQNFRLQLAGSQIGSAVMQPDANGYINFDFSASPVKIDTGSRELKVLVNVVGGSGRNFTASFRQASDLYVVDSQYNQAVKVTASSGSFPSESGQQTISAGTLTITKKNDSPSGDIVKDKAGAVLAEFEFKANGERMKVENLRAYFDESDNNVTELRNGAIFADGVQIGSTQDILETSNGVGYTEYSLGSSLIVNPGTPRTIQIRADVADGDGTDSMTADETITAGFKVGSSNVQRLTSLDFVNSTAKDGNQLTIKTGSFTAGKDGSFANQFVVSPSTGVQVGQFTLIATSAENINVNTISIDHDVVTGTFIASDLTNMYIKVLNDLGATVYTSPAKSTVSATASNSYSVNFALPVNKTYKVQVFGDVASGETADHAMTLDLDASGITVNSSSTATATAAVGQTVTVKAGLLTRNTGSLQPATLANGGDTKNAYSFTLTPEFDNFYLDEVYVDLSSTLASSTGAVANLILKANGVTIGNASVNTSTASASFTGLNYQMAQLAGTKTFTVDVQLASVGVGANDTGGLVIVQLDGMKYRNSAGSITTANGYAPSTNTGNAIVVHKAYPVFTNQTLPTTDLAAGTQTLFKTKIASSGSNNVGLKKLIFSVQRTVSNPTIAEATFKVFENGVDITSLGTIATISNDTSVAGANTATLSFVFTTETAIDSTGKIYELKGDVGGTVAGAIVSWIDNVKTTQSAADDYTTVAATTASVVWTDGSASGHASTTDDWMNDYLIRTIDVSQTLTTPA